MKYLKILLLLSTFVSQGIQSMDDHTERDRRVAENLQALYNQQTEINPEQGNIKIIERLIEASTAAGLEGQVEEMDKLDNMIAVLKISDEIPEKAERNLATTRNSENRGMPRDILHLPGKTLEEQPVININHPSRCNWWTHFPKNGDTIYITGDTKITNPTTRHARSKFEIVDVNLRDLFCSLNHQLFFYSGLGWNSNYLFVSFKVGMSLPNQEALLWKKFVLCWDDPHKQFIYHNFESLPSNVCFANFYNHTPYNWQENAPKIVNGYQVKLVSFPAQGIQGVVNGNSGHSEPGALGLLEERKDLILDVIRSLNPIAKIKMFQLGLHSFLDFCEDCNPMVSTFQKNYCNSLLNYLHTNLPGNFSLKSRIRDKSSHILFLINGINNRFYLKKSYFYYEKEQERKHNFTNYFLQQYRPFVGELPWNKKEKSQPPFLTYVHEPVAQPDSIENLPDNLRITIPLNQSAFYWNIAARSLYDNVEDIIQLFTPNLVMMDLTNARLGVNKEDDYGDSWSASKGEEFVRILKGMQGCTNLQHLNLSGNYIVQYNVVSLFPVLLPTFSQLTFLSFANALPHDQRELSCISQTLKLLPTLTYLDLSRNGINFTVFNHLMDGLCGLPLLKILNLSWNRLSVRYEDYKGTDEGSTIEGLSWVCDFISGTPTIQKVSLRNNDFDGVSFDWSELEDEVGVSKSELKEIRKKLLIEKDAGNSSSGSTDSSS